MTRENALLDTLIQKHIELPYLEFLPSEYDAQPAKQWPLVLFLHGAGERGRELSDVAKLGLAARAAAGDEFPFIIIAPQCPESRWWHLMLEDLEALLRHAVERYRVDTSRIYVTGLSMGGFGTWHFATEHPHALAAIAPVCGGGDNRLGFPQRVRAIAHLPVWAFHGDADEVVPPRQSRELVQQLRDAGATNVKLTLYSNVGHDSWKRAYDDPNLYDWLLKQKNENFEL